MNTSNTPSSCSRARPLALASEGERVRISLLHGNRGLKERLTSLGLNIGCEFEVLQHLGHNIVVRRAESRIALGGGMATKVLVIPL